MNRTDSSDTRILGLNERWPTMRPLSSDQTVAFLSEELPKLIKKRLLVLAVLVGIIIVPCIKVPNISLIFPKSLVYVHLEISIPFDEEILAKNLLSQLPNDY